MECGHWGTRWASRKLKNADVDVGLLMWDIQRRIDLAAIPDHSVLVAMHFRGAPRGKERFFLHFKSTSVELCLTNPGHEVDLTLSTTPRALAQVWMGEVPFASAVQAGDIRLEGAPKLARAFPNWLELSVFAHRPRPTTERSSPSAARR